jgi:hypothetical protein
MAFGEITKQLAQQALGNTLSEALEGKPAPVLPETVCGTILAQIQAMQRALKPEEELVVLFRTGPETIRVLEFYAPSWQVLVMTGLDSAKNVTRIISPADSLQLVCKVMQAQAPAKPIRINFIAPKPKAE